MIPDENYSRIEVKQFHLLTFLHNLNGFNVLADVKIDQLTQKLDKNEVREGIFFAKNDSLLNTIQKETDVQRQMSRMIPAQFHGTNGEEIAAQLAFDECINELSNFYKLQDSGGKFKRKS